MVNWRSSPAQQVLAAEVVMNFMRPASSRGPGQVHFLARR
jgi:hypothetical protein